MKYEEPIVEFIIFYDDMDVITASESTGGLGNIGGDQGADGSDFDDLL